MKKYIKILYPHFIAYALIAPIPILCCTEVASACGVAGIYALYLIVCLISSIIIEVFRR